MNVVVAGGTGLIGKPLTEALIQKGYRVSVLTRNPTRAQERMPTGCHILGWDGKTMGSWEESVARADVVINLAGENIGAGPWTKRRKERILNSRLDATGALVRAMNGRYVDNDRGKGHSVKENDSANQQLFISASGKDFYGNRLGELLTEKSVRGKGFLAETCGQWEESAFEAAKGGAKVVVLRLGFVLARGGALTPMQIPYRLFVGGPVGSGDQWVSWIHLSDVIGMVLFLIDGHRASKEGSEGEIDVWNAVTPHPVKMRSFAKIMGQALKRPSWFRVPSRVIRHTLGEMSTLILSSQRVEPVRAKDAGYTYAFEDLLEAFKDVFKKG